MNRGLVTGAVAGIVGTWVMSEAQRVWTRAVDGDVPESAGGRHDARDWQERSEGQNSNELAAQAIARSALGRCLTRQELHVAAPLMHYLFGAAVGAVYGAYAQRRQARGSGALFGATVWLAADEIAMPLLGLSQSTTRRPLEMHLQSLVAHFVFGTATEMTRRSLQPHSRAGGGSTNHHSNHYLLGDSLHGATVFCAARRSGHRKMAEPGSARKAKGQRVCHTKEQEYKR